MSYLALLDGGKREEAIEVRRVAPGVYEVELRGRKRTVSAFAHDSATLSLLEGTRSHSVQLDRSRPGVVKVQVEDSTFAIELLDERRLRLRRAAGRAAGRQVIEGGAKGAAVE